MCRIGRLAGERRPVARNGLAEGAVAAVRRPAGAARHDRARGGRKVSEAPLLDYLDTKFGAIYGLYDHGQTAQHAQTDLDVIVDGEGLGHRLGLRLARDGARRRARDIRGQFAEGHAGLRLRGEGTREEHDKRQDQRHGPGGETEPAKGRGRGRCRVSHLKSSDCTPGV
jgi:hypothetical protein